MRFAPLSRRGLAAAVLAGLAALAAPGSARAAFVADSSVNIVSGTSVYGLASFSGTLAVDNISKTSASIQITVTNTSPLAGGQFLDSIAFSLPTGTTVTGVTLTKSAGLSANWRVLGGPPSAGDYINDVSTGPFGNLDFGVGIGPTWHTSGTASDGLKAGAGATSTGTFTFDLTGTNLNVLTAQALLTYLSDNNTAGVAFRFRDATDATTGDKVLAKLGPVTPPPPPPGNVPAPPAVLLALAGVGCLAGRGAFRRKAAPPTV